MARFLPVGKTASGARQGNNQCEMPKRTGKHPGTFPTLFYKQGKYGKPEVAQRLNHQHFISRQ
jgi:hypothetical protein